MPSNNPRVLIQLEHIGEEGEREVLRPVAPVSLWPFIMNKHHASVFAVHHGAKTTLHWIRSRFWWPKVGGEVIQYVGRCKVCQRGKAPKPANKGLLRGRRQSVAINELCMGLNRSSFGSDWTRHAQTVGLCICGDWPLLAYDMAGMLASQRGEACVSRICKSKPRSA